MSEKFKFIKLEETVPVRYLSQISIRTQLLYNTFYLNCVCICPIIYCYKVIIIDRKVNDYCNQWKNLCSYRTERKWFISVS